TQQRLGKIPLILGMPVMICQNFDVNMGIVNGCIGTLKSLRYFIDGSSNRHATSCVVHCPDIEVDSTTTDLGDHDVVVLQDAVDM
ncbi:hypothetical protein K474DRAFT_1571563, partial [Panus rudis PR-1116 ss-1]